MNSMKVELSIILTLLVVSMLTIANTFMDWVSDVYGITAMSLLILIHILWTRKL